MRHLALAALATIFIFGASSSAFAASADSWKRCRGVVIRNGDGTVHTQTKAVFQQRTSCAEARRVARRFMSLAEGSDKPRPYGFRCSSGADGVSCKKGTKRVSWGYYDD